MDRFVLGNFLMIFSGSFFITLFVLMMQFTWRYVDEIVGKGITMDILGQFYWYMAITMVPMALPLAVLLASLVSFGNMGERLELLAMKAAGVSLLRIMRPLAVLVIGLAAVSFYFQNRAALDAQKNLTSLLWSLRETSPALEIPEGVFYGKINNFSLYVERKDVATGKLYNVMIYKTDQGFDKAQIVVADSGRLEVTNDKEHLIFDIWNGEQFENLQAGGAQAALNTKGVPYDRETFQYKRFIIDFNSNFEKQDAEQWSGSAITKNLKQLSASIDSMNTALDSIGLANYKQGKQTAYYCPPLRPQHAAALKQMSKGAKLDFDTIMAHMSADKRVQTIRAAAASAAAYASELEWKSLTTEEGDKSVRSHRIQWHQKFTMSIACIFFFFIGAPLGAIIRKGGLGMPTIIAVILFIFYYIINTSGMKMARDGAWNMIFGMWVSTAVLTPLGCFLTYKANNDSVVFNADVYAALFKRLLGLRSKRNITRKEVIIEAPDYAALLEQIADLEQICKAYAAHKRLYAAPSYIRAFFKSRPDHAAEDIQQRVEQLVEELSNSDRREILYRLNQLPLIYARAHTSPFEDKRLNILCGVFLPVGFIMWLRIWRFRLRLHKDMKQITAVCSELSPLVAKAAGKEATSYDLLTSKQNPSNQYNNHDE
ncbi:LptF/LptG family permease [uncultured Alloprevotella sp.]|uniref:LptF/LptG family permease n=1 Tax=uncultured Alloprevotella sp. TaxID=1283315 RepID=UPI0026231819|nr:LptF/LptG family permease [uncultured Alloprevotella sp.]